MPPLFWPLFCLVAGIAASPVVDTRYANGLIPLVLALAAFRPRMFLIVVWLAGAWLGEIHSPNPPALNDEPTPHRVTARLVTPPQEEGNAVYLLVEVLNVDGVRGALGRARLAWYRDSDGAFEIFESLELGRGDRIGLLVELRRPSRYRTPGVFDYRNYLERQGIYWVGTIRSPRLIEVYEHGWHGVDRLREQTTARIARYFSNPTIAGLVLGMVLGKRRMLPPEDDERFEKAGLIHMLVVSGFNMAVVAAVALRLGRSLPLGRYRRFGSRIFALALILGYASLVDGGAPVMRATLMACLLVTGTALDRGYAVGNALAMTAFVILIIDPSSLSSSSFLLSFGAVLAILMVGSPLSALVFRRTRRVLQSLGSSELDRQLPDEVVDRRVALRIEAEYRGWRTEWISKPLEVFSLLGEIALVTAAIQVCLLPFAIESFHRLSPASVPLNVLGAVVAGIVTPLGLLLILVPQFAGATIAWILSMLLGFLVGAVDYALTLPAATMRAPSVPAALWLGFALTMLLLARSAQRRHPGALVVAGGLLMLVLLTMALGDFSPHPPRFPNLTFLDVGQGDSTLIELPDGSRTIIDGGGVASGNPFSQSRFRIGEDVVSTYLFSRRIRRIDTLVLTHAHTDHMDGLVDLVGNFEIGEAWLGPNPMVPRYRELLEALYEHQIPIRHVRAGQAVGPFLVLNPAPGHSVSTRVRNDDSVVLLFRWGDRSVLLPGDFESRLPDAPDRVDVLKVPHHGSQNTRLETQGRLPIISVGANNRFGHPARSRLPALRTDLLGTIRVALSPEGWEVTFPAL